MDLKQIPKNIHRIYILGGPGSGKTYLANILSKQLKIKSFDLDDIVFEIKYTAKRAETERAKILKRIHSGKRWIIEGAYTRQWVYDALQKSDIIILLDFPITTTIYRTILREIHRQQKNNLKNFLELLRYGITYKNSRIKERKIIPRFKSKLIIIKNKNQVEKLIQALQKPQSKHF
ncbi:MAG: hypothetical protein AABX75_02920 [Nanoarchaeota archaeon]